MGVNIEDSLNRSVKIALDTGEAQTIEEAEHIFRGYQLHVHLGPEVFGSPTHQAAALTAVNTAARCFLGGVMVSGEGLECPSLLPSPKTRLIGDAIQVVGGTIVRERLAGVPNIAIGSGKAAIGDDEFGVRATFEGWNAGIVPIQDPDTLPEATQFVPSGVLSAAIAVSEAFQFVRGGNSASGKRQAGISLWRPGTFFGDFHKNAGPIVRTLPAKLWILGLGHIGQAVLWTLGLLPYEKPSEATLVLQDFDRIVNANLSTCLLSNRVAVGQMKTREMAAWCDRRGFTSLIVERRFSGDLRIEGSDPRVLVCGVDNPMTRASIGDAGFDRILEAGIGSGTNEYLAFQIHGFPASQNPRSKWGGKDSDSFANKELDPFSKPGYRSLLSGGDIDQCGITLLAGKAVGASFVGAATASLLVSELFRMGVTDDRYEIIDATLRSPNDARANLSSRMSAYNPGLTRIRME